MFHRGAELPGSHPRLEGDGELVRTMRFTSLEEVNVAQPDIEAAIQAWVSLKDKPLRSSRTGPSS